MNLTFHKNFGFAASVLCLATCLSACRGQVSEDAPIVPVRNMYSQPRYNAQSHSDFFQDGRTMRPQVAGTVSREMEVDVRLSTGRQIDNSSWVLRIPQTVVDKAGGMESLSRRGQERYNIYCAPCHSEAGDGQGMIAKRADSLKFSTIVPPTFHDKRLQTIPDGQLYATITNGLNNMPAYKHSIPQQDRWAIVAYVRALQLGNASRRGAMLETHPKLNDPKLNDRAEERH